MEGGGFGVGRIYTLRGQRPRRIQSTWGAVAVFMKLVAYHHRFDISYFDMACFILETVDMWPRVNTRHFSSELVLSSPISRNGRSESTE